MGTVAPLRPAEKTPVPNIRQRLDPEDELEMIAAFGDVALDEVLGAAAGEPVKEIPQDTRLTCPIVHIFQDDVFVDLTTSQQGVLSLRQFTETPEVGQQVQVVVQRYLPEENLYQLSLLGQAVEIGDWSQVAEGMLVEARITGHNKGGLECDVSQLRGFIPAGQVSLYRIEDLSTCVGETMVCLVTQADPERRNLVLSRRAVLEREKAEAKEKAMATLAEGHVVEGVVRKLQDFGAFIDIGGVDGLLHISQLSWQRVKHPSDILSVGQGVRVVIKKIDPESGKISLGMRDLLDNPWTSANYKFPVSSTVRGRVTRIMDFGAFIELEPGVEGLVHISELSHGRVFRVRDVLQEGQEIEAKVVALDMDEKRISLSIKALMARPELKKSTEPEPVYKEDEPAPALSKKPANLKGGVQRPASGEKFGLKW
jgi:small subunit ribosomal protein S1